MEMNFKLALLFGDLTWERIVKEDKTVANSMAFYPLYKQKLTKAKLFISNAIRLFKRKEHDILDLA